MPVWRVLENYVSLKLVNPYFIKQLPGKKSDVKDAEWIATCLLKDLIKGSYVPDDLIQQLRQYDRRISDLNAECVRKLGKLDAALQRCNIRISNYVSTTDGKSYKEVVRLISEGTRANPHLWATSHTGSEVPRSSSLAFEILMARMKSVVVHPARALTFLLRWALDMHILDAISS